MQANLARSLAGGADDNNWQLIESVMGTAMTGGSFNEPYELTRESEPDGTLYNFKAVVVQIKAMTANNSELSFDRVEVYVEGGGGLQMQPRETTDFRYAGAQQTAVFARKNGILVSPTNTNEVITMDGRQQNIVKISVYFRSTSSFEQPTNVQFSIYAIRA